MIRLQFTLFIASLAFSAVAQHSFEILTSIATKGKKQGLYDVVQNKWISPLSNQYVFDLGNDFYGTYDKKTKSIQGIFHNKDFTKRTNSKDKLYIEERIDWYDYPIYEMGGWSFTNEGKAVGRSSFNYAEKPQSSIGIVPISSLLLVGQSIGKNICDLTIVEVKKGRLVKEYKNVKWKIDDNKLYIAHCKIQEKDDFNAPVKIEVLDILNGELNMIKTFQKDTTAAYNELATWITDANAISHPNPKKSFEGKKKSFEEFYASDFKKDSSEKYPLIKDLGEFVVFGNENGIWVKTPRQFWLNIEDGLQYDEHYYEENTIKGVAVEGDLVVLRNAEATYSEHLFDPNFGEPMYDDLGNPVYVDVAGVNNSGIWNKKTNAWVVKPDYYNLGVVNNKIVADNIQYEVDAETGYLISQKENYIVLDLEGNSLQEFRKEELKQLFSMVYDADSLTELERGFVSFHKNGRTNLVDLNYFFVDGMPNEILSFDDNFIPGTYNQEGYSSLSISQGEFYFNVNLPELGNYQIKVNQPFYGKSGLNKEAWENEWLISKNKQDIRIASGIENYGDYSIIRNVSQTEIMELPYFDVETGYDMYDENGNPIYIYEITKGHYNTGLWDNKSNKWLLQPAYEDIIITKNGFTALLRNDYYTDWVDNMGYNRSRLDSTTTDYLAFDSAFNLKTKFTENDEPWSNPKYLEYLSNSEPFLSTIQHPKKVHEGTSAYSGKYTWVKSENGYAMYDIDGFSRNVIQLIVGTQWMHESMDVLYYIKNDSLHIKHIKADAQGTLKLPNDKSTHIIDCDKYLQLVHGKDTSYYNLKEDLSIYKDKRPKDLSWNKKFLDLTITEKEIVALNPGVETIESYGEYDDYFYAIDLKISDDLVWVKENNEWSIKVAAANIKDFNGGFYIDSNYVSDAGWEGDYFVIEDQNNYTFYDQNLSPIKELKDNKLVSTKTDHGLTIVEYIGEYGYNALAIFDAKGNLMAKDIFYYEIETNEIICTPIDPVYGEDLIDENGDFLKYTFQIE
jgi:hypothetical protein